MNSKKNLVVSVSFLLLATASAQITIPGNGTLQAALDFENAAYVGADVFDYGSGWAGAGYGLSGTQRGAPENIYVAAPPAGGLSGSTQALFFERENRASSTFYTDNPEAVGTSVYGGADATNQDDFYLYSGSYTPASSLSLVVRYYVDLTRTAYSSFALRSTTYFTDGVASNTVYPAVWTYTANGGSGIYNDLKVYLRVPDFSQGSYKIDIHYDLPDTPGWWTLGLSFSPDGDVHYFASSGVDDLTMADYMGSGSTLSPGYTFANTKDAVVMISTSNYDGSNTIQTMDDIEVHVNTAGPPEPDPQIQLSTNLATVYVASDESEILSFDVSNAGSGSLRYALTNDAAWIASALLENGDFELPISSGWTFADILTTGDHASQGYYETGSWTPTPAVSNAYYNLGRSSQLSQISSATMVSGTTYRVSMAMRKVSTSYAQVQVAFTDAAGADLVFDAGHAYAANLGSGNGSTFNMNDDVGTTYEAAFTAGAAEHGQRLGLRISSVRDVSTALAGIDDVQLGVALGAGESFAHQTEISAAGLTNGTYNGSITVYDENNIATSQILSITLIVTDDRDGDGIPDDWELAYSGSTTGLVASGHNDTDGISNFDEYILGYSPVVSNPPLEITTLELGASTRVTFGETTNARIYSLEFSEDLTSSWTNLASGVYGSNEVTTIAVPDSGSDAGFYRVNVAVPE